MKTNQLPVVLGFFEEWLKIFYNIYTKQNQHEMMYERINNGEIPDVFIEFIGLSPMVVVTHPNAIKEVLSHRACDKSPSDMGSNPHSMRMFGDSLLHQSGKKAMKTRSVMNPAFKLKKLQSLIPVFIESANEMVDLLKRKFQDNAIVQIDDVLKRLTFDIIGKTAFGYHFNSLSNELNPDVQNLIKCFQGIGQPLVILFGPYAEKIPTNYQEELTRALHESTRIIREVITKRRNQSEEGLQTDLLDLIIQADNDGILTDNELISNTFLLFLAGQETSASSLVTTMYQLGKHPDIQHKAYEEVMAVCGGGGDIQEEHLHEMKYLEAIINESLRILSPVGGPTARIATEDLVIDDYFIPKGTNIGISWIKLHRSTSFFESPLEYYPDRWLENPKLITQMLAFSYGPRVCIGKKFAMLEMKVILASLLLSFSWSLEPDYKFEVDTFSLALRPLNGLGVIFKKRS